MALSPEWRRRLEQWRQALPEVFYRPLDELELSGFTTTEQLTTAEAAHGPFEPMPSGTPWGAKWEYGWFRTTVTLPEEAESERIVLRLRPGGALMTFVDGRAVGQGDPTLTTDGVAGETYDVLTEAYAGHGPTPVTAGPVPPGVETVPEPPESQQQVGTSTFGIWEEEAYQLWMDLETLFHLRESLDEDSLRVSEIDAGLREMTTIVDVELPRERMLETVRRARERLRPLLECTNGSTSPVMYAYGHGHLDVAWLWPLQETDRKAARTLGRQLELAAEYPEHKFLHSQAELFRRVRAHYPELYKRVKDGIGDGSIVAEGSTWVEMDTNISGGESLVRQFLYGKRFYREELGVETELLWLPDAFGYSGALPQVMRGCGVKYFSTAKIFWNYNGGQPFPHNTFTWEGIDGSKVLVHLCNNYNSEMRPSDVVQRWCERRQKDGISTRLMPFGWGDGGGGPERNHLEFARRESDLEGCPRVRISSPIDYFKDLEERGIPDVNYVGELYFQAHRGTYTSQARTKRGNRKAELALREAEMWGTAAAALNGLPLPDERLDEAWKRLLTNQFHDILPGTSIARVYEEAEAAYEESIRAADEVTDEARGVLTEPEDAAITVFNSLSWERTCFVQLPDDWDGAVDNAEEPLPVQGSDGKRLAEVTVPPCGWTTLHRGRAVDAEHGAEAARRTLENDLLRVEFNERGEMTSIVDKETGRELAAGPCNNMRMYKDVPTAWDAWDIDSMYEMTPVDLPETAEFEVLSEGPLVAELRIRRRLANSEMSQVVRLRRGSRRVEFDTTVDWQEQHRLLKVNFPVNAHANEALHEIQFGHLRRPTHASMPFDADRFEVCNHKWTALAEEGRGCAVLNDCKYGVNVDGNSINLTLLRAPVAPDMHADLGEQRFTYAFYGWNGGLTDSGLVRAGYELNCPVGTAPGDGGERSLFRVNAPNIVVETVKAAEDGSGDIILRLYESMRTATNCRVQTSLPAQSAQQTNMLEEQPEDLPVADGAISLSFRPFEIKTLRLNL